LDRAYDTILKASGIRASAQVVADERKNSETTLGNASCTD
jgi:hypothetical protein